MTTYQQSGVDIQKGDDASAKAYQLARKTFASRKGMIGEPIVLENGFSGVLDMGNYYLVQNDDGVGTKIMIAQALQKFDTIGIDLLAMVLDDAVCLGAEVISVTNTIDTDKVDPGAINSMLDGLQKEASRHHVVVPGGEIAELKDMAKGYIWNATAVGIVEKDKLIIGKEIHSGDSIIALKEPMLRSNGFTLARYVLEKSFGEIWPHQNYADGLRWGEVLLTPSTIYHSAILEIHGRYGKKAKARLKGVAHITGGGIPGNFPRILPVGLGADLDNLFAPHNAVLTLQELGNVSDEEAYQTWNMGNGMLLVSCEVEKVIGFMKDHGIEAQIAGRVTDRSEVVIESKGYKGGRLSFEIARKGHQAQ